MIILKYLARYLRAAARETTPAAVKSTSKQPVSFLGQLLHTNAQTSSHKYTHTRTRMVTLPRTHRETVCQGWMRLILDFTTIHCKKVDVFNMIFIQCGIL